MSASGPNSPSRGRRRREREVGHDDGDRFVGGVEHVVDGRVERAVVDSDRRVDVDLVGREHLRFPADGAQSRG